MLRQVWEFVTVDLQQVFCLKCERVGRYYDHRGHPVMVPRLASKQWRNETQTTENANV